VIASLAPGGHVLLFGLLSGQPVTIDPRFLLDGSKRVEGFLLSDWAQRQKIFSLLKLFRRAWTLIREGVLSTDRIISHPLADFHAAVEQALSPGKPGKVVLRISDS
jgi:NADPH:quinone reductase-like Zn-dependent oxidoreductase